MIGNSILNAWQRLTQGTRGQAITLEAVVGAIILLLMVLFALQSTVITPLSASTANQQIEEQNRAIASDILDTAAEENEITPVILNWNESQDKFNNTDDGYYTQGVPTTFEFGELLYRSLTKEDMAYNLNIEYQNESQSNSTTVVYQGQPSYNAVTTTETIFLYDHTVESSGPDRYIPDISADSQLHNVVRVKLVVWRM